MKMLAVSTGVIFLAMLVFERNFSRVVIRYGHRKSKRIPLRQMHTGYQKGCKPSFLLLSIFLLIFSSVAAYADATLPDRRKDQFPTSDAHLIVPLPYSYPGIGDGFFLMGNFSNLRKTTTDFLAMVVTGDAGGYILQFDELPIVKQHLFAKIYYQDIDRAQVNQYDVRGMDGTSKNEFNMLDVTLARNKTAELNLTFFDRRLNFLYQYMDQEFKIKAIRDHSGDLIKEFDEPYRGSEANETFGIYADLTDDYLDPRKGTRFSLHYQNQPKDKADDPSYYVLTYNMSLYLPMFKEDTLAMNYYQSNAHVTKQGNTNPADIRAELGLNCDLLDTECLQSEQKLVDNFINHRTNGTSANLGGKERLRSYPQDRFKGGHSAYFGIEYRWNFKQETAPFNYLFWKDVRTGLQVAFFGEIGSVSENSSDLWDDTRYSYGTGLRLVAASGAVYRADIANGDEGSELTVFFFYPW